MEKIFEQSSKMMEQAYDQWRKVLGDSPLWPKTGSQFFQDNMSKWIAAMSAAYASNMDAWNTFTSQNEDLFFKTFKESPFYNENAEVRMREAWDNIIKAQKTCQDIVKESLSKIEVSVKESQAGM
jgi:hypothetical protein